MIPKIYCFLFGHKFYYKTDIMDQGEIFTVRKQTDECERCYKPKYRGGE